MRGPTQRRAARLAAAGITAAAAAALAVVLARRRRGPSQPEARRPWSCACGQAYLVRGVDRHRVYWLPDAPQSDPLLVRDCVSCGTDLPAGHDAALV